jgi:transposase
MARFKLASRAYQRLREIARASAEAQQVRHAQGLLWLHAGNTVEAVAHRLGVTRRAVYYWVARYHERRAVPVAERVRPDQRSGRPPEALRVAQKVIRQVWSRDPRRYGFRALVWTVPMLRCQIEQRTGQSVSLSTVRRALRRLRYRYKRPRLVLARRSPTWRQAKGGLNAG